jgi:SagB-type dehydrogenase family enzyme
MTENKGYAFVESTKYPYISESAQRRGLPQPSFELPLELGAPLIDLPGPAEIDLGEFNLRTAIEQRVTRRHYTEDRLSLEELSYLLWLTQGNKTINEQRTVPLKTVPSAGCRHPFETYLSVNKVAGLEAGLYRFVASTHQLVALRIDADFNAQLAEVCLSQRHVTTSAVTFIWAAVPYRTVWRYSERSYRYLYLDAGHVCQNLYLAAESIHCGVCAIGAFDDDGVDALLGCTPPECFVIYLASLGRVS